MIEKRLDNSPIYYYKTDNNKKQTIMFVHSAFADHTQYNEQIAFFEKEHTVLTIDLVGHGKSIDTKKGDGIDKTAEYIKGILDKEEIQKIHLVGVSIGAILIQDFANLYPDRVASLSCFGGYDINNFDVSMQKENSMAQMVMMLKAVFSIKWFAKSNMLISACTAKAQREFYQMNIRFKKKSFMYLATLNSLVNKHKTINRSYPLLIGCGKNDIPMELKAVEMWHFEEPESKVVIFENAGHLVNMDVPDKFNECLQRFIFNI